MIIKQCFLPVGHPGRPGIVLSKYNRITIHWIGPYPGQTPEVVYNGWLKSGKQPSAHFIVKGKVVWQVIPECEVAWHAGSMGNYDSLGIECIPMDLKGEFDQDTIDTVGELLKRLAKVQLERHFDQSGKDCPRYYTNVTDLVGIEGRVANPLGGDDRWLALKEELEYERSI